jgi:hypothetical protein
MSEDYSDREAERILAQVAGWGAKFAQSPRFGELSEEQRGNVDFVIEMFAEHMYSYFLLQPEQWNPANLEECCLGILPRKITADAGFYRSIAPVLAAFFGFLGEQGLIRNTASLAKRVTKIGARIPAIADDRRNWGIAKTLAMDAETAGVDITDPKKLKAYIDEYNAGLDADTLDDFDADELDDDLLLGDEDDFFEPAPVAQAVSTKIGRNEPCPCGSGKKYKKCCALKD